MQTLVKASSLPVLKIRRFLHANLSCTNIVLATRQRKKMNSFAWFKNNDKSPDFA